MGVSFLFLCREYSKQKDSEAQEFNLLFSAIG
jgi:hypothetical protein